MTLRDGWQQQLEQLAERTVEAIETIVEGGDADMDLLPAVRRALETAFELGVRSEQTVVH